MTDTLARQRSIIGTSADWAANDLILGDGELALERLTTGVIKSKVGNGALRFSQAPYLAGDLDMSEADPRYVQESETRTIGGVAAANLWPRLGAGGKLDFTLLNMPATTLYRGNVNATIAPPPGALPGDAYTNTTAGTVHAGWGAIGGQPTFAGDYLIMDTTPKWNLVPTAESGGAAAAISAANAAAASAAQAAANTAVKLGYYLQAATQSVPDSTTTLIAFGTAGLVDNCAHIGTPPTNIIINTDGCYSVEVQAAFAPAAAGFRHIQISINGASVAQIEQAGSAVVLAQTMICRLAMYNLAPGNIVTAPVYQTSGTALNLVQMTADSSKIIVHRMGDRVS